MSKRKMSLREIDAEIARVVFGWTLDGSMWVDQRAGCELVTQNYFTPTTNIERAFEVVDIMRTPKLERDGGQWRAELWNGKTMGFAWHDSLPLAIAFAALAAHGIDVEATDHA